MASIPPPPHGKPRTAVKAAPVARPSPPRPNTGGGAHRATGGRGAGAGLHARGVARSVEALRRRNPTVDGAADVQTLAGYRTPRDGGEGVFVWTKGRASDDGGIIIVPHAEGPRPGYWQRLFNGAINVKWFGAVGDAAEDPNWSDRAAIQAAVDTAAIRGGGTVIIPLGTYLVDAPIMVPQGVELVRESPESTKRGAAK